ncbi:MAG: hypothetical protein M3Y21_00495 [Candidatus Eremiobacteraeota bacterium]|nr:hypothetical protein [Candidatus Eremiobacteraeota bacterium]
MLPHLILAVLILAASPQISRAAGIATISAYAGTWHSHIEHYKTAYSKARVEDTNFRNDCWRSAGYFACDQFVNGPSAALIVFTYDPKGDVYHTYTVPTDGSPAGSGKLIIAGNTWTFPWQDEDNGKKVYARVVNVFRDPNTIEFRSEYSLDNTHWIITGRGIEHRVSTPQ